MSIEADMLGHVWRDGRCRRCEMYLREAPADVMCHPRDWLHVEEDMDTGRRVVKRVEKSADKKKIKPRA